MSDRVGRDKTNIEPFTFKMHNRHTGEVRIIISGQGQVPLICPDCRGYMGTPCFDSGTSETKYCDCWELVRTKNQKP